MNLFESMKKLMLAESKEWINPGKSDVKIEGSDIAFQLNTQNISNAVPELAKNTHGVLKVNGRISFDVDGDKLKAVKVFLTYAFDGETTLFGATHPIYFNAMAESIHSSSYAIKSDNGKILFKQKALPLRTGNAQDLVRVVVDELSLNALSNAQLRGFVLKALKDNGSFATKLAKADQTPAVKSLRKTIK